MQISVCLERIFIGMALTLILFVSTVRAEMASVYGGSDGIAEVAQPTESD
jgi:hypothetical protein